MQTLRTTIICLALMAPTAVARADDVATLKLYKSQCSTCHGLDGEGQTTAGRTPVSRTGPTARPASARILAVPLAGGCVHDQITRLPDNFGRRPR